MKLARARVVYRGRVQGVGFRYTARSVAARHRVSGWVHNLADGGVELEAQGDEDELRAYLGGVRAAMSGNIRDEQTCWISTSTDDEGFSIRF